MKATTKIEIEKVIQENWTWCKKEKEKALKFLETFPDDATIEDIVSRTTNQRWLLYWARDIGNRDIIRDKITHNRWVCAWAKEIGDRDIMRDRVTENQWAYW